MGFASLGGMERRVLSRPVKVHWAGWTSDTYMLQQHGWSISADEDPYNMTMAIAINRQGFSGYSRKIGCQDMMNLHGIPTLHMQVMGQPVMVHTMGNSFGAFVPIDAKPQMISDVVREQSLEHLVHFAPQLVRTNEIIIPEENVDDLLQRIIKMQQPARTERMREAVSLGEPVSWPEVGPREKVHAQILSLG